jgi:hypothetical protein
MTTDKSRDLRNAASALAAAADALNEMADRIDDMESHICYLDDEVTKNKNLKQKILSLLQDNMN